MRPELDNPVTPAQWSWIKVLSGANTVVWGVFIAEVLGLL